MGYATKEQLQELASYMASQINVPTIGIGGGYAPIGSINFFDATTAPQDWLACDGTVYNIADYPQLADWYEAQHGSKNFYGGNGTTTFAVPDLQGEFLRGTGTNSHANQGSGANVGVHQDGTKIPNARASDAIYVSTSTVQNYDYLHTESAEHRYLSASTIPLGDNYGDFTSRPTNTSFLICVKAVVAGEVYSTDERVVGTWIDGKPIYEKTIEFTTPSSSGVIPNTIISNLETCISICFTSKNSDEYWIIANPTYYNQIFLVYGNNGIEINYNNNPAWIYNRTAYTTILYTKTTD